VVEARILGEIKFVVLGSTKRSSGPHFSPVMATQRITVSIIAHARGPVGRPQCVERGLWSKTGNGGKAMEYSRKRLKQEEGWPLGRPDEGKKKCLLKTGGKLESLQGTAEGKREEALESTMATNKGVKGS